MVKKRAKSEYQKIKKIEIDRDRMRVNGCM